MQSPEQVASLCNINGVIGGERVEEGGGGGGEEEKEEQNGDGVKCETLDEEGRESGSGEEEREEVEWELAEGEREGGEVTRVEEESDRHEKLATSSSPRILQQSYAYVMTDR